MGYIGRFPPFPDCGRGDTERLPLLARLDPVCVLAQTFHAEGASIVQSISFLVTLQRASTLTN